jgi:hypothetical protein
MAFNSADTAAFKNVWVFCEQRQGVMMPTTFELISEGRKLANELGVELCGILLGDNVDGIAAELGEYGADKVYVYNSPLLKDSKIRMMCRGWNRPWCFPMILVGIIRQTVSLQRNRQPIISIKVSIS